MSSCMEAHENASKFASAYALGPMESGAAINLLRHIPKDVKTILTNLVRTSSCFMFLFCLLRYTSGKV